MPAMRTRRGERGMVLIITLLVAVGLSILGAIIIEATRADTATAGHARQADQTHYVAEIGTMVGIRTFALNYSIYRRYMRAHALSNYGFNRLSFDVGGPPGTPVTLEMGTIAVPGSVGFGDLSPEYAVLVDRPYEFGDAAGYSVSGTQEVSFCFRRYTFTSAGEMDVDVTPLPGSPRADSRAAIRATSVMGPTDCTL